MNVELREDSKQFIIEEPVIFRVKEKPNIIKEKTYRFAIEIIHLYKIMLDQHEFVLSKQVVRSGTSIGANIEEAIAAQSRKDFISKMAISSKEARETNYWLRLLRDSKLLKGIDLQRLIHESEEIIKIISSIVKTSKSNLNEIKGLSSEIHNS